MKRKVALLLLLLSPSVWGQSPDRDLVFALAGEAVHSWEPDQFLDFAQDPGSSFIGGWITQTGNLRVAPMSAGLLFGWAQEASQPTQCLALFLQPEFN